MERRDSYKTITYNVDEDGVVISQSEMGNYLIIHKHKPIYEKRGNNVRIIRTRIVRKSNQLTLKFGSGDGGNGD